MRQPPPACPSGPLGSGSSRSGRGPGRRSRCSARRRPRSTCFRARRCWRECCCPPAGRRGRGCSRRLRFSRCRTGPTRNPIRVRRHSRSRRSRPRHCARDVAERLGRRRTVCMRSTLILAAQFSSVSGIARALTLATTTSRPPKASADLSTQAVRASPSPTSTTDPVTSPRLLRSLFVAATSPESRAQKPTTAPSSRKAPTIARPMPRVPPVTRTRVPVELKIHGAGLSLGMSAR